MKKINVIDDSKDYFAIFLHESTVEIYEATAVFFEIMYLLKNDGILAVRDKINNLRENNQRYHQYLKPLLPFINIIDMNHHKIEEITNMITTIVYHISVCALNTPIYAIPIEVFENPIKLRNFKLNKSLSHNILPFYKFTDLIKKSIIILEESDNCNSEDILVRIMDFKTVVKHLLDANYRAEENQKVMIFIMELFKDSKEKYKIESYLHTLRLKEVDLEEAICYAVPSSFRKYKAIAIDDNKELNDEIVSTASSGALFLYGKFGENLDWLRTYYKFNDREVERMKNKQGHKYLLSVFNYDKKKYSGVMLERGRVLNILSKSNQPLVVSYKIFNINEIYKVDSLPIFGREVYVYCDRAYPYAIEIINSVSTYSKFALFLTYGHMDVLLIKLAQQYSFFLPILPVVKYKVLKDIESKRLNIKILDRVVFTHSQSQIAIDKDGNESLHFNKQILEDMDKIINNIFQF